jgi:hypothetical protein
MSDRESFRVWLDQTTTAASHTPSGIPLLDLDGLDLKDAQAVPLISALADIIEATCVLPAAVPMTHATAA